MLLSFSGTEELNIFSLNSDNDTALSCAVKEGNDKIVDILLSSGGKREYSLILEICNGSDFYAKKKQFNIQLNLNMEGF